MNLMCNEDGRVIEFRYKKRKNCMNHINQVTPNLYLEFKQKAMAYTGKIKIYL
jgi:hypothetical protein